MGYTQNCEIWHGASLGTLFRKINLKDHLRTMFWQQNGHILATYGITASLSGKVENRVQL